MPTAFVERPICTEVPRKYWNRTECDALQTHGALDGQHLELIDGDLIDKMGAKPRHVIAVLFMHVWLSEVFGPRFVVQESPIDVSQVDNPTNEPEPDLIVLSRDGSHFTNSGRSRRICNSWWKFRIHLWD